MGCLRSNPGFGLRFAVLIFIVLALSGCATIPQEKGAALETYSINGIKYVSLFSLCSERKIEWDYDTLTRSAFISSAGHRLSLVAQEKIVIVDGAVEMLKYPPVIYEGVFAVPYSFKDQVFDPLFPGASVAAPAAILPLNIKKVVIDAGHGGKDPGALGKSGLKEKDVALDISKRLSAILKNEGIEVVMTRSSDVFIPLERRVDIANSSGAELFISIHANANRVRSLKGFEVYYLSKEYDDQKRAVSSSGRILPGLEGSCFPGSSSDLRAILWDMIYNYNRGESISLSGSICDNIERDMDSKILGIKGARYMVLRGAQIPAILIEVGFLSNNSEEGCLRNSYYRQRLAESIRDGVVDYARRAGFINARRNSP